MVIAEISTGRPARNEAMRATFIPDSASGVAQPRITSSISFTSRPLARAIASLMVAAARSSGRLVRSVPLGALPTAVRTELTITASRMIHLPDGVLRVLDALSAQKATTEPSQVAPASLPASCDRGSRHMHGHGRIERTNASLCLIVCAGLDFCRYRDGARKMPAGTPALL